MSAPALTREQRGVLLATGAANALILFDQTSVTVGLPAIQRDFGSSSAELQWTIGAYLLSLAALMSASGRLADLYGRRKLFLAGVIVFGAASVACALAPSELALIGARFVQGMGAALTQPLALANATRALPPERQGWAVGFLASMGAACLSLGPLVGGVLVEALSWRWIFLVNVPIVAIAVLLALRYMPESTSDEAREVDWRGLYLLTAGLAALVTPLLHLHEWSDAVVFPLFGLSVLLLAAFVVVEQSSDHPLIPLRLLAIPSVAGALAALLVVQLVVLGVTVYVVLYLQKALGLSALEAGFVLLPAVIFSPILSTTTGRLADRHGSRRLVAGGLILAAAGLVAIAVATQADEWLWFLPGLFLFGLSRPFVFTPASTVPVAAIPASDRGLASSLVTEARQIGAVMGVAMLGAILNAFEHGSTSPDALGDGLQAAMLVAAAIAAAGAVGAGVLIGRRAIASRAAC